jgi:hypothetical protein
MAKNKEKESSTVRHNFNESPTQEVQALFAQTQVMIPKTITQEPEIIGKVLDINPANKSPNIGLFGEIENKLIDAENKCDHELYSLLHALLCVLGELKVKLHALDKKHADECKDIIDPIKNLMSKCQDILVK